MQDPDDIWTNYPPAILAQAHQSALLAEQQLLSLRPCNPDPYNAPVATIILRWWARRMASGN
jgi:hypothetical protein